MTNEAHETARWVVVALALLLALGGGTWGAVTCSTTRREAFKVCVQAGHGPAECAMATNTANTP